jgi:hypothetical protein
MQESINLCNTSALSSCRLAFRLYFYTERTAGSEKFVCYCGFCADTAAALRSGMLTRSESKDECEGKPEGKYVQEIHSVHEIGFAR